MPSKAGYRQQNHCPLHSPRAESPEHQELQPPSTSGLYQHSLPAGQALGLVLPTSSNTGGTQLEMPLRAHFVFYKWPDCSFTLWCHVR